MALQFLLGTISGGGGGQGGRGSFWGVTRFMGNGEGISCQQQSIERELYNIDYQLTSN